MTRKGDGIGLAAGERRAIVTLSKLSAQFVSTSARVAPTPKEQMAPSELQQPEPPPPAMHAARPSRTQRKYSTIKGRHSPQRVTECVLPGDAAASLTIITSELASLEHQWHSEVAALTVELEAVRQAYADDCAGLRVELREEREARNALHELVAEEREAREVLNELLVEEREAAAFRAIETGAALTVSDGMHEPVVLSSVSEPLADVVPPPTDAANADATVAVVEAVMEAAHAEEMAAPDLAPSESAQDDDPAAAEETLGAASAVGEVDELADAPGVVATWQPEEARQVEAAAAEAADAELATQQAETAHQLEAEAARQLEAADAELVETERALAVAVEEAVRAEAEAARVQMMEAARQAAADAAAEREAFTLQVAAAEADSARDVAAREAAEATAAAEREAAAAAEQEAAADASRKASELERLEEEMNRLSRACDEAEEAREAAAREAARDRDAISSLRAELAKVKGLQTTSGGGAAPHALAADKAAIAALREELEVARALSKQTEHAEAAKAEAAIEASMREAQAQAALEEAVANERQEAERRERNLRTELAIAKREKELVTSALERARERVADAQSSKRAKQEQMRVAEMAAKRVAELRREQVEERVRVRAVDEARRAADERARKDAEEKARRASTLARHERETRALAVREQREASLEARGAEHKVKLKQAQSRKDEAMRLRAESTATKRQSSSPRGTPLTRAELDKQQEALETAIHNRLREAEARRQEGMQPPTPSPLTWQAVAAGAATPSPRSRPQTTPRAQTPPRQMPATRQMSAPSLSPTKDRPPSAPGTRRGANAASVTPTFIVQGSRGHGTHLVRDALMRRGWTPVGSSDARSVEKIKICLSNTRTAPGFVWLRGAIEYPRGMHTVSNRWPNRTTSGFGPGLMSLYGKAGLVKAVERFYTLQGLDPWRHHPLSFVLPQGAMRDNPEWETFRDDFDKVGARTDRRCPAEQCAENMWLLKPSCASSGKGIGVANTLDGLQQHFHGSQGPGGEWVVQKYIEKPLLYAGRKFDVRIFVMLESTSATRSSELGFSIYAHREGYGRTSAEPFNLDETHSSMHLTNFAVQRVHQATFGKYERGNCVSFGDLQRKLGPTVAFRERLVPAMHSLVVDTILAARTELLDTMSAAGTHHATYRDLLAFDIIFEDDGHPLLLEINPYPGMVPQCDWHGKYFRRLMDDYVGACVEWGSPDATPPPASYIQPFEPREKSCPPPTDGTHVSNYSDDGWLLLLGTDGRARPKGTAGATDKRPARPAFDISRRGDLLVRAPDASQAPRHLRGKLDALEAKLSITDEKAQEAASARQHSSPAQPAEPIAPSPLPPSPRAASPMSPAVINVQPITQRTAGGGAQRRAEIYALNDVLQGREQRAFERFEQEQHASAAIELRTAALLEAAALMDAMRTDPSERPLPPMPTAPSPPTVPPPLPFEMDPLPIFVSSVKDADTL